MKVTRLESVTKTKSKVYVEEEFAFVLYKGELARYRLEEGAEITQEQISEIEKEILEKRVKLRAMHLLTHMERTESQLRRKLMQDLYTPDMIEIAIQYVTSFGYLGDEDYARRFVGSKQSIKSKREIQTSLLQKGISKDVIEQALEVEYEDVDETEAIRHIVQKKRFEVETASDIEKKKMQDYLLRKGFRYEDISKVLQVSPWNA